VASHLKELRQMDLFVDLRNKRKGGMGAESELPYLDLRCFREFALVAGLVKQLPVGLATVYGNV